MIIVNLEKGYLMMCELLTKEEDFVKVFFDDHKMPCCGKERIFYRGASGGLCTNIKCFHCGEKFNVGFFIGSRFIEKI